MKQINLDYKLKKLNFIIASHIFVTGPALDLEEYLRDKAKCLFFIGHPFSFAPQHKSFYRFYKNRKLKKEYKIIDTKLPQIFLNIKDIFLTIYWSLTKKEKFDYYIGSDSMMACLGLILKVLGKVDNVILYTIDYMPQRFRSPILNRLYHFFDKMCLKYCKVVWNVSPNMVEAREKYDSIMIEENAPQIVVPLGIWYKRISKLPINKKDKFTIVFMGHLLEKQGLDVVIKAMPKILTKISEAKLLIIGTGEYENKLKDLVSKLKLDVVVEFTGYIDDHRVIEKKLAKAGLAVAMYKPDKTSFTNWSDPGKLKNYLAAGLPIFLTSLPHIAKELEKRRCGFVVSYDEKKLATAIISLLVDEKKLKEYSKNAINFSKYFDWDLVFKKAFLLSIN